MMGDKVDVYPFPTDLIIIRNRIVPNEISEELMMIAAADQSPDKATTIKRSKDGGKG